MLSGICQQEHTFTMKGNRNLCRFSKFLLELKKIEKMNSRSQEKSILTLKDHYQNNVLIFKKNFRLILEILVDDIWDRLTNASTD